MLKEYLARVDLENSEELNKLQIQMKSLLDELNTKQKIIDRLRREKNLDINIFSPRNMDAEADEKIEKAMQEKLEINQKIEYVRGLIETYTKKKMEYEELRKELMESDRVEKGRKNELRENNQNEIETEKSDIQTVQTETETEQSDLQKNQTETETEQFDIQKNKTETEYVEKENVTIEDQKTEDNAEKKERRNTETESLITEDKKEEHSKMPDHNGSSEKLEGSSIDHTTLLSFLDEIYRQTELCMAMTSNRNQCKTELRNLKNKIKNYAAKIEAQD